MEQNIDTQNNGSVVDQVFENPVSQDVETPQQEAPSMSPADAFKPTAPTPEGTPSQVAEPQPGQEATPPKNNDEVRYEYWQSQAAKANNQLKEYEQIAPLVDYIKANPYVIQNVEQGIMNNQGQPEEVIKEDFPEAPVKPERPRNFSREEAISDTTSDSARYMDEMDEWRDKTDEYNRLFTQYQTAKIEESFKAQREREANAEQARIQQASQAQQASEIQKYAVANFGADENLAAEFVKEMSAPESVSMDNLWQLFLMKKGINQSPGQAPVAEPSPQFQQTQAAQQIPNSMGVMPAAAAPQQRTDSDSIMDDLVSDYNSKNPWS